MAGKLTKALIGAAAAAIGAGVGAGAKVGDQTDKVNAERRRESYDAWVKMRRFKCDPPKVQN